MRALIVKYERVLRTMRHDIALDLDERPMPDHLREPMDDFISHIIGAQQALQTAADADRITTTGKDA